jgi:hypothetical protein
MFESGSELRTSMIKNANKVTYWIVESILECVDLEDRCETLAKCIKIARYLKVGTEKGSRRSTSNCRLPQSLSACAIFTALWPS